MARKSQILRLITFIAFVGLFIILLMNIFNNGQSYYYIHVERKLQMQQTKYLQSYGIQNNNLKKVWPNITFPENATIVKPTADTDDIMNILPQLQMKIPSLPITYYFGHIHIEMEKFKNCAQYPPIQMLNFYNTYWQTFNIGGITFHLYGAYYDVRPATGPVVRILAMINHINKEFPEIYSQLWFENESQPVMATINEYNLIWNKDWGRIPGLFYPYLMTCKLPQNINITGDPTPKVISLVEHQCDMANNSLRIIYNKPEHPQVKHKFAVCVKGLDFPYKDLSSRLVEWLEMLKILGVHKVYMHQLQVHANISKVLEYYSNQDFVEVQNLTLVGSVVGLPELQHWLMKTHIWNKRLNELIPYNDCFYRNMYKYEYIALLDIDEIIIPQGKLKTWQELLATVEPFDEEKNCISGFVSLCASNVYYPDKFEYQKVPINTYPSYMHMLNHGYRFAKYSSYHYHMKCLHNTQHIITLHNHFPLNYFNQKCRYWDFPTTTAQLQHYRDINPTESKTEKLRDLIWDANIERFKETLMERCTNVLKDLQLIT